MPETAKIPSFYLTLDYPTSPPDRPYVFINMITTIDGKTLTGERGEPVHDMGSKTDHEVMRRIQASADAVLIGAGSQRSSAHINYDRNLFRIVATRSGNVLVESRFFNDAPAKAIVLCPEAATLPELPALVRVLRGGQSAVEWTAALRAIRDDFGVNRLLIEGGSEINGQILGADLADELFLTVAPKVKLGANVPTYAGGEPLPRDRIQDFDLLEEHVVGNEVFLRYRRRRPLST